MAGKQVLRNLLSRQAKRPTWMENSRERNCAIEVYTCLFGWRGCNLGWKCPVAHEHFGFAIEIFGTLKESREFLGVGYVGLPFGGDPRCVAFMSITCLPHLVGR